MFLISFAEKQLFFTTRNEQKGLLKTEPITLSSWNLLSVNFLAKRKVYIFIISVYGGNVSVCISVCALAMTDTRRSEDN